MMSGAGAAARFALLLAVALVLQVSVMAQVTPLGVLVDLPAVLAVGAGIHGGSERGALAGFAAGLVSDLLVQTPFGMATMVLTLVGYAGGALSGQVASSGRTLRALIAGALAVVAVLTFVMMAWLLDLSYVTERGLGRIAAVNGVATALLNPLSERAVRWALLIRRSLPGRSLPGRSLPGRAGARFGAGSPAGSARP
ncbi:MAG TPA: rod shape-determining protein MreD [Acidimicrobiaceae bacterium]|nr:rod shape-determining protein MreD [Acidimicrobiaceae bacterium]HCB36941.1 rod shape-determining protein MreD [Acidimicrobiaceae bacterium]